MSPTFRFVFANLTAVGVAVLVSSPPQPLAQGLPVASVDAAGTIAGAVTVTAHYKGKGTVDDQHRIWIWVFDTPDIGPGAMPVQEGSISTNGGTVSLDGIAGDRVWIAVAYDERGGFAGNAAPSSGSPLGLYLGADGRPAPVSTDEGAATVVFDDSVRMP